MLRFLPRFASYSFPLALALFSFAAIPAWSQDLIQQQGILVAVAFGIACCLIAAMYILGENISFHPAALLGVPLLIIAAVSNIQTPGFIQSVFGNGFELGTVGSFALFAGAVAFGVLGRRATVRVFLTAFVGAGAFASLGAVLLRLGFDVLEPFGELWLYTSFMFCSAALVAAILIDAERNAWYRISYAAALLSLLAGVAVFFDPTIAGIGIGVLAAFVVATFTIGKTSDYSRAPLAAICMMLTLAAFLAFGLSAPPITGTGNAYPSLLATEFIIEPVYTDSLKNVLIGAGPNSFSYAWGMYRPQEVNMTPLWNYGPTSSYSTAVTFTVTLGLLGLFALFLCPIVLIGTIFSQTDEKLREHIITADRGGFGASFVLSLFLFISMFWYPVEVVALAVAGLSSGFSARFLFAAAPSSGKVSSWLRYVIVLGLIGVGGTFLWVSVRQFAGAWYHSRALSTLNADAQEAARAAALFEGAARMWPTSVYERDGSRAAFLEGLAIAYESTKDIEAIRARVDTALRLADKSVRTNPRDFDAWLSRAFLYTQLVPDGPESSAQNARESLERAGALAPTRPDVPYMQAVLEVRLGNAVKAREYLEQSIKLKPDYKDALELLQALNKSP